MDNVWERARARYAQTPVPEELSFAVASAIRTGSRRRRAGRGLRRGLTGGLAACACFVLLVNASPTFAQAVSGVPVLGPLARVFTVAEYTAEDDGLLLDVRLPGLENTGNEALEERVNAEITTRVQALLDEAQQRAQQLYRDQTAWNRMSLVNIAGAGRFAADRAIRDYARDIWRVPVKE